MASCDLAVVGAGIVGLAHALAAARRGLRVAVFERDAAASMASIRNFGFVTVSGQAEGLSRFRAIRSRDIWREVAAEAGIAVHQRGAMVVARRPEALTVLAQFAASEMGDGCELLDAAAARARVPRLRADVAGALVSPHELRVEARDALPALARHLESRHGVAIHWNCPAIAVDANGLRHAGGHMEAAAVVVAPGAAVSTFDPALARRTQLRQCKLQMMRLAAPESSPRLPHVVMADLSLLRYEGFAAQPGAKALRDRIAAECHRQLSLGVHLIVAQSADGSLVVGDSHRDVEAAEPFGETGVDEVILDELRALFDIRSIHVVERWVGHYPVAEVRPVLRASLGPRARLVCVTGGTGMSTAFALGEETVAELFG